jgi:Domain of unknown function (DUF1835)
VAASAPEPAHVVNGDCVARTLERSPLPGSVIVWRDVLHEGAVPPGDAATVRRARAEFLSTAGFGASSAILAGLEESDAALLAALAERRETVLWFEHDLHDQLQLIQILDRIAPHPGRSAARLIAVDRYPGHERFTGLGELSSDELAALWPQRARIADGTFDAAARAYGVLRSADPVALAAFARARHPGLPFLGAALRRLLEERPWSGERLGRSERQILSAVEAGAHTPAEVFAATWQMEAAPYMGDAWVWRRIDDLASGPWPLLAKAAGRIDLTERGRAAVQASGSGPSPSSSCAR